MEPQEEEQTLKIIFEGIRGLMGRKIPFTLHRTEEACLSGPRYLGCFLLMCEAVLQLDDSFNYNLCLINLLYLCWKEKVLNRTPPPLMSLPLLIDLCLYIATS